MKTYHLPRSFCLVHRAAAVLALSLFFSVAGAAAKQQIPVPQVDAGIGPCMVDFSVSQSDNKPLYNAEIAVKIAYGFMGMKKMDLKVGTNSEGKARFVGLPEKVHNPPLAFVVSAEGLTKTVNYWPRVRCRARYSVIMGGR